VSNPVNSQTDRQTNKRTDTGENIIAFLAITNIIRSNAMKTV